MNEQRAHKKEMPYGLWKSDVTIESLVKKVAPPTYPFRHKDKLYWLTAQPHEQGRIALMRENPSAEPICMTPANFNIRSAVHEYGGRCFCLVGDSIIFNNYEDGNLYRQSLELLPSSSPSLPQPASPQRLSGNLTAQHCCGYVDLVAVGNGEFILGVIETSRQGEPHCNSLIAISSGIGAEIDQAVESMPIILAQGADFYANPVVSSDGTKIAWFEWNHPNMPWDQSRLLCADLLTHPPVKSNDNKLISLDKPKVIVDQPNCAVCQLGFLHDNRLIFVSDSDSCDYWSMFQYASGKITRLTYSKEEFGEAHWLFGQHRWQSIGDGLIIAVATREDGDVLVKVDSNTRGYSVLHQGFSACSHLQGVDSSELLFIAHHSNRPAEIVSLSLPSASIKTLSVVFSGSDATDANDQQNLLHSEPRLIKFSVAKTRTANSMAYGYFYPPCNMRYDAPKNTLPPLVIVIHGGPTGRATSEHSSLKQYFCSLGFALLDINHRGSTGLGRKYRQSLLGNWGEFDADDIVDAINFVGNQKWIDKDLVFIRGSSAGGYTVLRSLTRFPQQFAGGACYYGIGNLVTLSNITHKFESSYTDNLVGERFNPETATHADSRFVTRSPVSQINQLSSPLILFQGKEDKVVPPALSREVIALLKKKGIKHSYTEYSGEGHGFRQMQTRADALRKESAFFAEIISQRQSNKTMLRKKSTEKDH